MMLARQHEDQQARKREAERREAESLRTKPPWVDAKFTPKPDITAYELAYLLNGMREPRIIPAVIRLSSQYPVRPEVSRHFTPL